MKVMKNKKGFTLIEIIVVLVILAILAAVAVPSMIGMVSDARTKAYVNEARVGLTAAQAVVTELITSGKYLVSDAGVVSVNDKYTGNTIPTVTGSDAKLLTHSKFQTMVAEVTGKHGAFTVITVNKDTFKVTKIVYNTPNGKAIELNDGETIIHDAPITAS